MAAFVAAAALPRSRLSRLSRRPWRPPSPLSPLSPLSPPPIREWRPARGRRAAVVARQGAAAEGAAARPAAAEGAAFVRQRRVVFVAMSAAYALYVALRATWTYVSPVGAAALGLSLHQVGLIASAFPLAYGLSRLVTGVVADRTRPGRALGAGLLLAGAVNVAMSACSGAAPLALLWGLNGLVQGIGAGASARLLTSWHSRTERGKAWSVWSSSANVGAFAAPLACGWLATSRFGFRSGMLAPGVVAIAFALAATPLIRDSPTAAGVRAPWASAPAPAQVEEVEEEGAVPFGTALVRGVVRNRRVWALAAAYFFVYFVRQGLRSWLHFFLVDVRGCDAAAAAYRVSGMEVGGMAGTFAAGYLSDALDGRRVAVTVAFLVGLAASLAAAAALPAAAGPLADVAAVSAIGLFVNGPQCLIGLIGAEVCDPRVVATVSGVLGWVSYGGATAAGYPLSLLVRQHGWSAYFAAMLAATAAAALLLLPMLGLRGRPPAKHEGDGKPQ